MTNTSQVSPTRSASGLWRTRWFLPTLIVAALALALGGVWLTSQLSARPSVTPSAEMPINPVIEDRFGVRFTLMAVTAEQGWVDLRYRVLDPSKVMGMFGTDATVYPKLINETTGKTLEMNINAHKHAGFEAGLVYFIIYINYGSAFKSGDMATIQVGDQKIEHVLVR